MQITNNHNLPESFVNFARNDKYSKGKSDISVTTLIDSPRVRLLREANSAQLTSDASDMIWPLFGTAVHHILESSKNDEGVTLEERLYADVNGWILSGAVDHQKTDGKTISITDKTGKLVSIKTVNDLDDLMIINKSGIAIRMEVAALRVMGRATQGVRLINLKVDDTIAAVAKVMKDDETIEDLNDLDVNDGTIIE